MARRKMAPKQESVPLAEAVRPLDYDALVSAIAQVHDQTQRQAVQAVNVALTLRNWLIGYHELPWTPFIKLMRMDDPLKCVFFGYNPFRWVSCEANDVSDQVP